MPLALGWNRPIIFSVCRNNFFYAEKKVFLRTRVRSTSLRFSWAILIAPIVAKE